jgi:PAS domain S-box-containing protein
MNKRAFRSLAALRWGALEIAGIYLILGSLWIVFSDQIAARVAIDAEMLTTISLYKGWGYVIVTALLLYLLIRRHTSALQASENQLQRVIDAMPAFIAYVGADLHYRFANKRYAEWFNENVEGKHVEEVWGKETYKALSKYIEQALKGETIDYEVELPYQEKGLFVSATYIPDTAADRNVKGFFVLAQDRTQQKQAEDERRQWADAFEGCAQGIAIVDPNTNRIVVCNPAFARLHKSRVEEIVGCAILSLFAPSDHGQVRQNVQKADQIGHARFEASMTRRGKDGSTFPVEMDIVSILGDDGELLHRVATAQDISERRLLDEKLRESEKKYRTLAEHLPAITYISQPDQYVGITYISPQIESLGFDRQAWLSDPQLWLRQIHPDDLAHVRKELQRYQDGAETFRAEYRLILPDGDVRWFRDESARVKDDEGRTILKQGFMLDITDRKQAEQRLKHSEERYRIVSELTSDYAYKDRVEEDGRIIPEWVTESFTRISGYTLEEASAPGFWGQLVHAEDIQILQDHIQMVLSGQPHMVELRVITKSGSVRWLRDHANPIWDEGQNRVVTLYGAVKDITESKQAEESLRRFQLISENSRDIILFMDYRDGRLLDANAAAVQAYGYSRDELLSLTIRDLRASDTLSRTDDQMAQAASAGILFETMHQRKDGTTFPVEVSSQGATVGGVRTLISIVRDITERKQNEDALRLKDELLRLTSEMAKVGGWEFDPATGKGTWTDEVARIHDLDPTLETNVEIGLNFYQGEARAKIERGVQEAIELAKPYDLELEMVTARGNRKWVRTIAFPTTQNGKVVKVQGIFQDITERKQIEKALQEAHTDLENKVQERTAALSEANALLQALMDNIPDHIYFKDTQCRFIRNSRSQAMLLGLRDPSEAVGKTDFDFFPHASTSYADEQEVMRLGKPHVDFEEWVVWPDGREMWVSTTKMPLRDSGGQTIGIFGISRDITERKRNEQAIRQLNADLEKQAEQLQAANKELEAFSYSVSHDLRAPLRAIDGYTRILLEDYEPLLDSEGKRICAVISREARRMGQLIDDLLSFSRLGRKEMYSSTIDMRGLAVSVLHELLKDENQARVDIHVGKLPLAKGDSSLIRQVWVNLLSNALKFTSKKERAEIEVGSQTTKDEYIYFVRDNGAGFDMEYANKLFGVFQRLHSESEFSGTGVGLAIVQRIIRRHAGRVWAEGAVEKGATFYFALPRKEKFL